MEENNIHQNSQTPDSEPTPGIQLEPIDLTQGIAYTGSSRKKPFILFSLILLLLLITTGSLTAYAFRDNLSNSFAKVTKNPAEYYSFVEKRTMSEAIHNYVPTVTSSTQDNAYQMKTDVSIDRNSVDSLMKRSVNLSLKDLESQIGIKFDSVGLNLLYEKKDNILNQTLGLTLNKTNILSMELFQDANTKKYLARIPELSNAYINFYNDKDNQEISKKVKIPSSTDTIKFLERYNDIIVDHITKVERNDNSVYKLDNLSKQCTKLTVTITNEDTKNIIEAVLDQAKSDDYIINLLPLYNLSKNDYQSSINDAIANLQKSTETLIDKDIKMIVYVDGAGNIVGRNISTQASKASFGYGLLTKKYYQEYNFYINNEEGYTAFNVTGSHKMSNGVVNGDAVVTLSNSAKTDLKDIDIDLKYKDIKTVSKKKHSLHSGTYYLSSSDLMGLQITSDFSIKDEIQMNKTTIELGTTKLATIDSSITPIKDFKPTMPNQDAKVYSMKNIQDYYSTINIGAYLQSLSEKLGLNLGSLLGKLALGSQIQP